MLVDFADTVLTLIDLKMLSVASFYSGTFFYIDYYRIVSNREKRRRIFHILPSCCSDIECQATFAPISFTGTTLQCVIFPWIIYLEWRYAFCHGERWSEWRIHKHLEVSSHEFPNHLIFRNQHEMQKPVWDVNRGFPFHDAGGLRTGWNTVHIN